MMTVKTERAQVDIPQWAFLERRLFDVIDQTPDLVMKKYVRPDGSMLWPTSDDFQSIDALDDMYESFHNWPLYYLLGGDERFLELSHFEYDAITKQFARYGCGHGHPMVVKEYEQGYDWMHQGEGYLFFYLLNLADPDDEKNRERSIRYAGFYIGEDPEADNYDPEKKMMRCCYVGSMGAASRNFDQNAWGYADWKAWYGLPYLDVAGVQTVEDLKRPEAAGRMAAVMKQRLAHSDTVINLFSTTMVMNAYLHTGEAKYKNWIDEYVGAWRERTVQNGGIVPDNVGHNGEIGGDMDGKWYGGYYGWTWPHGFYFIGEALTVAGENQCLLHGDPSRLDWVREQTERLLEKGEVRDGTLFVPNKRGDPGAHIEYRLQSAGYDCLNGLALTIPGKKTDVEDFVRYYEKDGWFEFAPMQPVSMAHVYSVTHDEGDLAIIRRMRNGQRPEWDRIRTFYSKDQGGHEAAWLEYLAGEYPDYPEEILRHAIRQVYSRVKMMREDTEDPKTYTDSYLQRRNPVNVEALIHLTTGGIPPIYNGGLFMAPLRYFDADRKRPGLPKDVSALVSDVKHDLLTVTLVNTGLFETRNLVLEAGCFGEHRFQRVEWQEPGADAQSGDIDSIWLKVSLAPASIVTLNLSMERFVNHPAYRQPWE